MSSSSHETAQSAVGSETDSSSAPMLPELTSADENSSAPLTFPVTHAKTSKIAALEDWAHMVDFVPSMVYAPKTLDELRGFLQDSVNRNSSLKFRALGSMHSCADIVVSDAVIDVSALPHTIVWDSDNNGVVASANFVAHDFMIELSTRGKSLTCLGGTDAQTLAGLISTNTGPATVFHTIYELLDWVEYFAVDAANNNQVVLKRLTRGDADFGAAVASLGVIGFITTVRFRVVDEAYFQADQLIVPLDECLKDLDATSAKYQFWRIDWVPKTDKGLMWRAKVVPIGKHPKDGDYPVDGAETLLKRVFRAEAKIKLAFKRPITPFYSHFDTMVYGLIVPFYGVDTAYGPLRNMIPVDRKAPLLVCMAEWSFLPADTPRVRAACTEYFNKHEWPNLPIEIECMKTDDFWMSAWNWGPDVPYIIKFNFMYLTNFLHGSDKEQIRTHLHGLWDFLNAKGIPFKAHWGKINFMDKTFVETNMHLDAFRPHIQELFMNDYIKQRVA